MMDFKFRKSILLLGDVVLLPLALLITLVIRFWGVSDPSIFLAHALPFSFLYLIWLIIFYVSDLYDLSLPPTSVKYVSRFVATLFAWFLIGAIYFYLIPFDSLSPKTILLIHIVVFGALAFIWRFWFFTKLSSVIPWRIGLLGEEEHMDRLKRSVESHKHLGYKCITLSAQPVDLAALVRHHRLHVVILCAPRARDQAMIQQLYQSLGTGVTLVDLPQAYELFVKRIPLSTIDQRWFLENAQQSELVTYKWLKRAFDIVVALTILILTLPLWLLIAALIKLTDGGTVFYSQERVGKNCKPFHILKFRSMRADAEAGGAQWAAKKDSRVTRIGEVLRKSHLDELPQMLNVLKGDISLVGPRPERPEFVHMLENEIPHYHIRHFFQPGFTGWAQINFRYARSVMDSREKFEYDLYYIKNRSLILDMLILLKTARLLIR
jgi:exopolysaccharide biosynthesis polyprenyl glycosylphosphotransferase